MAHSKQSSQLGEPSRRASTPSDLELCFKPATILAAEIRDKNISPVEVIDALYARLHQINPKINAFCTLTEEKARLAARESEAAVMRGDHLGALHGVPVSVKDLLLTRGVRTMYGSRIRENYVVWSKYSNGLKWRGLGFSPNSLLEWTNALVRLLRAN